MNQQPKTIQTIVLIAILALSPVVIKLTKDYFAGVKAAKVAKK